MKGIQKAKAFSKLAKVAEFQLFTHCITSKINGRIKQICTSLVEKLHILYTHLERGKWFERKKHFRIGRERGFIVFQAHFLGAHILLHKNCHCNNTINFIYGLELFRQIMLLRK